MADYNITSTDSLFAGLEPALKVYYSDQKIRNMCYEDHPLLGMLEKKEDLKGLVYPLPLVVSPETGASHDFATAQGSANSFSPQSFMVQTANDYVVATIPTKAMLASEGDAGAFLDRAFERPRRWQESRRALTNSTRPCAGGAGRQGMETGLLVAQQQPVGYHQQRHGSQRFRRAGAAQPAASW